LSMLSPVWRAILCGNIGASEGKLLSMDEDEEFLFSKVVALGCGEAVTLDRGLEELIGLGRIADRYQVEAIHGDVEEALMYRLTVESCGPILTMASGSGLVLLETASRELALREFDQFSECDGFLEVSEEVLGSLLDDDDLIAECEERVLMAVVRWIKSCLKRGAGGVIRGEGLLRKIRFPFISAEYLTREARAILPESAVLEGLVLESCLLKHVARNLWAGTELRYLDAKMLTPRRGVKVDWAEFAGGRERRLAAGRWAGRWAYSVSVHGRGFVCGGLDNGSIQVWNRATLAVERTLIGHTGAVLALVSVQGWLISGSSDHEIKVWDMATGRCEGTLKGHMDTVRCLAVSGDCLVSGSFDGTAKVWRMKGLVSTWRCERSLAGHVSAINCMATWEGKMASGLSDETIRVWDVGTGRHEQTLVGHERAVVALVVWGQRLISSSSDKTVKVWSMATWTCVQTVRAYAAGSAQFIGSLAVSGSTLVGGSISKPHSLTERYEARLWDLDTLRPLHTIRQAAGQDVGGLVSDGGEVWGAVGEAVVVWGRQA
jgi:hypothetical protein